MQWQSRNSTRYVKEMGVWMRLAQARTPNNNTDETMHDTDITAPGSTTVQKDKSQVLNT